MIDRAASTREASRSPRRSRPLSFCFLHFSRRDFLHRCCSVSRAKKRVQPAFTNAAPIKQQRKHKIRLQTFSSFERAATCPLGSAAENDMASSTLAGRTLAAGLSRQSLLVIKLPGTRPASRLRSAAPSGGLLPTRTGRLTSASATAGCLALPRQAPFFSLRNDACPRRCRQP